VDLMIPTKYGENVFESASQSKYCTDIVVLLLTRLVYNNNNNNNRTNGILKKIESEL
jgi:hypothetical protein